MIDLEKIAEKAWNAAHDQDLDQFDACVVLKDAAMAIKQAQETIAALEKDAGRLDFLGTPQDDGQGLRYEVNCLVVNGVNKYAIYDDEEECFLSNGEWSSTTRQAIDTAMEAKHG